MQIDPAACCSVMKNSIYTYSTYAQSTLLFVEIIPCINKWYQESGQETIHLSDSIYKRFFESMPYFKKAHKYHMLAHGSCIDC